MPTVPKPPKRAAQQIVINQPPKPIFGVPGQQHLFPVTEVEYQGVAMGVLSDGTPYLHLRGLARLCGVDSGMLYRLVGNWTEEKSKPRGQKIAELLIQQGFEGDALHLMTLGPAGPTPAYTDAVCMALLEYYAFDAKQGTMETAQRNYRLLARKSFRAYIYDACGYNPDKHLPESWRTLHERILLNDQIPVGYFSIFREVANLVIHMIKAGCPLDSHTVPDGSVGIVWANYWNRMKLAEQHGDRLQMDHYFPDWFPQATANPVAAWVYPVQALGDFHMWLYTIYLPENFPRYIHTKVTKGIFLPARATALIEAVRRPSLPALPPG